MIEANLGDGGAADQETGVRVDLDATDSSKAVQRERIARSPRANGGSVKDWAAERAETSRQVKARLGRITNRFNQQLADQEAAHQRQLAELNGKLDRLLVKDDDTSGADETKHQAAMDALQAKLEEAQERGDSKAVAAITREMSAADAKFWAQQTAKKTGTPARQETDKAAQQQQAQTQQRQPTKAGVAWARANGEWWNDTVDETASDAREYANRIHKRRLADGDGDPESAEYFEEIGDMVRKRFPEIEVKSAVRKGRREQIADPDDDDDDDEVDTTQRRVPSQSIRDRGARGQRENLATLTRADIQTMREVGMNPDSDKHVVQFLRSKREEAEAQGADA